MELTVQQALGDQIFGAWELFKLLCRAKFGYVKSLSELSELENKACNQYHELVALTDGREENVFRLRWLQFIKERLDNLQVFFFEKAKKLKRIEYDISVAKKPTDLPAEYNAATRNTYLWAVLHEKRTSLFLK